MKSQKTIKIFMLLFFMCIVYSIAALANPISDVNRSKAKNDLKKSLTETYGNSFSTIEMLLEAGMRDYDLLCDLPENSVSNGVLQELKNTYYPSFSTILMLYKSNMESYQRLNN